MRISLATTTAALLLVTGCSSTGGSATDEEAVGTNRPPATEQPAEAEEPAEESAEAPEQDTTLTFGESFQYDDGVTLTIGKPAPFTPSESACCPEPGTKSVVFDVTIVNGGTANYDPSGFYGTLQSANAEADAVFDSSQGVEAPSTTVLPGREAKFKVAFAVTDPADLVYEVAPGFEYDSVIYTTS